MFKLNERKALVTGATGRIGEAIAHCFHKQGAIVGLHGTRQERLDALAQKFGNRVYVFPADLLERDAVKKLGETAEKEMNGVDILVNNAGVTRDSLFVRMSDEDWDKVLAINLTAVFNLTRTVARGMMRRRFGRIINIASIVGMTGNAAQTNYCAAKAGLIGFSKALAKEMAARNVTVNSIAPGFIESAMTDKLSDKIKERFMEEIPMKRLGSGEDVGMAATYLASNEAAYVTGQTLCVNGGIAMI
ncbi:MAG: 3-oxoacyl-[acyl-carrier protein] reductase [Candidatus Tokpelaia sp. JSC188]|nr:MAG: 3-oxoacyl-[acyl-carrier protein] reductase [Candidatus Tokpelaia sp. JSC188]